MIKLIFLILGSACTISSSEEVSTDKANYLFSHSLEEKNFDHLAYPIVKPRTEGYLQVSNLHKLFYALYGNPDGVPVVILHGGPGGGCDDAMVQFFDLNKWNVIMFDQRGAMRSKPFGCLEENTPQHLINDIETLREFLGIKKWVVFGGSWGSTLSLLYAQEYPDSCFGLILRGTFLARDQDYLHLFYGMGKIFPEAYAAVIQYIPENERNDLFSAYYKRIFDPNPEVHLPAAQTFMRFDAICSTHCPDKHLVEEIMKNDKIVLSVVRIFFHYAKNHFFLESNQILSRMKRIEHLPSVIVQGRYDAICLPEMSFSLYENWKASNLWMIPNGGHSDDEPQMVSALSRATNLFIESLESKKH